MILSLPVYDFYFRLLDLVIALMIYVFSVVLFLKYKRDYMTPILFFGLFVFPLQFAIWFLQSRLQVNLPPQFNVLEVFYIMFLKLSVLVTLIFVRR